MLSIINYEHPVMYRYTYIKLQLQFTIMDKSVDEPQLLDALQNSTDNPGMRHVYIHVQYMCTGTNSRFWETTNSEFPLVLEAPVLGN